MCEFVSWIEKDDIVVFLTGEDVFNTKQGRELQKYCGNSDDYTGHGAIRHYYNFEGGIDKECTDFSQPANFPKEIIDAIKSGKMRGLGLDGQLLTKQALAKYKKIQQATLDEYEKIRQAARDEYEKIEQAARDEYEKIRQPAWDEYKKIRQPAWDEYKKIEQAARDEYKKIEQATFWDLFADPQSRNNVWK